MHSQELADTHGNTQAHTHVHTHTHLFLLVNNYHPQLFVTTPYPFNYFSLKSLSRRRPVDSRQIVTVESTGQATRLTSDPSHRAGA